MPSSRLLRTCTAAAAIVALFTSAMPAAHADMIYNNLVSSQDGADPLLSYGPLADSFMTGAAGSVSLTSVSALLKNGSTSIVGDVTVSLHADSGNAPGATLVSLGALSSAQISTASFSAYAFSPLTAFALAANTRYWIELVATTPNAIEWAWSTDLAALGVAGEYSHSAILGTNANASFGPYQMAVNVTAVPEPASVALMLSGLGVVLIGSSRRRKAG